MKSLDSKTEMPINWKSADSIAEIIVSSTPDPLAPGKHNLALAYRDLRARMAEPVPCGVCGGAPLKSGRPCICGGIGTEAAEMHGLRVALFEAEDEIERLSRISYETASTFTPEPQDATSGINAVFGKWPREMSDAEVNDAMDFALGKPTPSTTGSVVAREFGELLDEFERKFVAAIKVSGHAAPRTDCPLCAPYAAARSAVITEYEQLSEKLEWQSEITKALLEQQTERAAEIAGLQSKYEQIVRECAVLREDSNALFTIAKSMGYTLLREDTAVRPAAMSYVKPSELAELVVARTKEGK